MYRFQTIILLFIVGLGVGILFAVQYKSHNRVDNPVVSSVALKEAKQTLEEEQLDIKNKVTAVRKAIDDQQSSLRRDRKTSRDLLEMSDFLRQEAGLTEIKDRGLVITLADSEKDNPTIDSIVHAADLRDVANVLWRNGARAIEINDQRLVSTTSIDSVINTILINNTKIANPFVIKATGDPVKLNRALTSADTLKDVQKRVKNDGLIFNITQAKEVVISAYSGGFNFNFATIKED